MRKNRHLTRVAETKVAGGSENAKAADRRDTRAGYSFRVSKAPDDIISIIKQTAPNLRPSERRVAEAILADVNFALHSANGELARRAGVLCSCPKPPHLMSTILNFFEVSARPNTFNNQGLLVAVDNPLGRAQTATYDILDRATNMVDLNGVTTTNTYDELSGTRSPHIS